MTPRRPLLLAALATPVIARAQAFPARPIRLVVGFPPGGGSDLVARPLADKMSATLGQPVLVENRGGANGALGLAEVARANPDGHVFGHVNNATIAINPLLVRNLPFNAERDFAPVAAATVGGLFFTVPTSLGVSIVAVFIALVRARPGQISFGSAGPGSITHLAFELFKRATRVEIEPVHYRGSAPALQDMVGGRVHFMLDGINLSMGQIQAGRVRAIGFLGAERHALFPDIPTVREQGFADVVVPGWQGFVAPAATPGPVLDRLQDAIRDALADPAVGDLFRTQGIITGFRPRAQMAAMIEEERQRWRPIITELNISLD